MIQEVWCTFHFSRPSFLQPASKSQYQNIIQRWKKSFFFNRETKTVLLLPVETISIQLCHVFARSFVVPAYTLKLWVIDYSYLKKLLSSSKIFTSLICLWVHKWYAELLSRHASPSPCNIVHVILYMVGLSFFW